MVSAAFAQDDEDVSPYKEMKTLARAVELIRQDYVDEDKTEYEELIYSALRGMLEELDPHSDFMDPKDFKGMQEDTRSEFGGLGVVVTRKDDRLTIVAPMEGTPGFRAGLLPGDVLLEIDGQSAERMSLRDAVDKLRGEPGTPVKLAVAREGEGRTVRIRVDARVRGQGRGVEARVRPTSVADLAWGAVHAVADPDVSGATGLDCRVPRGAEALVAPAATPVEPEAAAALEGPRCVRTRMVPDVAVVGPVHLDDAPRIDVAWEPEGPMSTAARRTDGTPDVVVLTTADVVAPGGPFGIGVAEPLDLPTSISSGLGDEPVCRRRGPSLLRLDGGLVRIRSPLSHPRHDGDGGPTVGCPGLDRAALDGVVSLVLPDPAVIEVRRAVGTRCAMHPLGIDPAEDVVAEQRCNAGTAYVWGDTDAARTVLAEDDVQVVWDIGSAGTPGDGARVGLVAGGSVVLRRPVGPPLRVVAPFGTDLPFAGPGLAPFGAHPLDTPTTVPSRWVEPRIDAVVVALGGSVRVQNPEAGQRSGVPILISGSLVQRFVGPTGSERRDTTGALQGLTGRPLQVVHDPALLDDVPPALPRIQGGRLRILTLAEVRTDGSGGGP